MLEITAEETRVCTILIVPVTLWLCWLLLTGQLTRVANSGSPSKNYVKNCVQHLFCQLDICSFAYTNMWTYRLEKRLERAEGQKYDNFKLVWWDSPRPWGKYRMCTEVQQNSETGDNEEVPFCQVHIHHHRSYLTLCVGYFPGILYLQGDAQPSIINHHCCFAQSHRVWSTGFSTK